MTSHFYPLSLYFIFLFCIQSFLSFLCLRHQRNGCEEQNELHKCYFLLTKKKYEIILCLSTINDVLWNQFYISSRQINKYASFARLILSLCFAFIYLFDFSFFFFSILSNQSNETWRRWQNCVYKYKLEKNKRKENYFCAHANIWMYTATAATVIEKSTWKTYFMIHSIFNGDITILFYVGSNNIHHSFIYCIYFGLFCFSTKIYKCNCRICFWNEFMKWF